MGQIRIENMITELKDYLLQVLSHREEKNYVLMLLRDIQKTVAAMRQAIPKS